MYKNKKLMAFIVATSIATSTHIPLLCKSDKNKEKYMKVAAYGLSSLKMGITSVRLGAAALGFFFDSFATMNNARPGDNADIVAPCLFLSSMAFSGASLLTAYLSYRFSKLGFKKLFKSNKNKGSE